MSALPSSEYSTPLVLDLRPSRRLRWIVVVSHLAVPLLAVAAWGVWLLPPAIVASALSFWRAYRNHLSSDSPRFVRRLRTADDGHWLLEREGGESRGRLSGRSLLLPGLCVLVFRTDSLRHCAVIVDDCAVSGESLRRLRVFLRREARMR